MCFDWLLKDLPFDSTLHCLEMEEAHHNKELLALGETDGAILVDNEGTPLCTERHWLMRLKSSVIEARAERLRELGWV